MGRIKTENVCKSLSKEKTYILVVDSPKDKISSSFTLAISNKFDKNYVHVDIAVSNDDIPNHDIYIMNINGLSYVNQLKTMKTIYKSNPRAALFLYGDEPENSISKLKEDLKEYIDPTKMGEPIQGVSSDQSFQSVISYISSVENTKIKLTYLWNKLEESNRLLDKSA